MYVSVLALQIKKRPREVVATSGLVVLMTSCLRQNEEAVYVVGKIISNLLKCSFLELCS